GPNLPVELVVDEVGLAVSAQVPVDARGPQVRARNAVGRAEVTGDDADALGASFEDLVAEEEVLELVAAVEDLLHHFTGLGHPAPRQVVEEPADAVEVGVESSTRRRLDEV